MKDTQPKRRGRPPSSEPLKRIQLMVFERQDAEAGHEAERRGVSISQVYREWIDAGRKGKRK
jgi:hypothetical protein